MLLLRMMLLHLLLLWLMLVHLLRLLLLLHLLRRTAAGTDLVVQLLQDVELVLLDAASAAASTSLLVLLLLLMAGEQCHELRLLLEVHAILALQRWLLMIQLLLLLRRHVASSVECGLLAR